MQVQLCSFKTNSSRIVSWVCTLHSSWFLHAFPPASLHKTEILKGGLHQVSSLSRNSILGGIISWTSPLTPHTIHNTAIGLTYEYTKQFYIHSLRPAAEVLPQPSYMTSSCKLAIAFYILMFRGFNPKMTSSWEWVEGNKGQITMAWDENMQPPDHACSLVLADQWHLEGQTNS